MPKNAILVLILVVTAILSLCGLSRGDTINDEVFYSFRAVGLIDFDEAKVQTTPWQWQDPNIAWWAKLSFHDHPPLVFWVQNFFMKIFGESNFGFRLPSALLGIASVYLVYLIGSLLFSEDAGFPGSRNSPRAKSPNVPYRGTSEFSLPGLLSAGLFGITLNHIYISRVGMQEAYVIFFLLLASYLFLKSLKEDKYLIWTGVALGLGFLAKYNVFILVPIFLTYLLFFKRDYFLSASRRKKLWLGALISLLIFSPVIIYNIGLYLSAGHFDFQFSYIFGQSPEAWQEAPGKEIGTPWERVNNFIPQLIASNSWVFLLLVAASLVGFCASLWKNPKETLFKYRFLLISIFYLLILLFLIGPSYRFLTMLTPFFALGIGAFLSSINSHYLKKFALFAITPLFIFEIFYSVNNQILYYPKGPTPWLSSKVRYENYNWGYNELGKWLKEELKGKLPAITFDMRYQFLEDLREKALDRGLARGLEPYPALFVYEGNFDRAAKLWVLDRLHIYHAWPIISLETYFEYLQEQGFDYYERAGFKNYYFIFQPNIVPPPAAQSLMRGELISIKNPRGEEVFQIYKF